MSTCTVDKAPRVKGSFYKYSPVTQPKPLSQVKRHVFTQPDATPRCQYDQKSKQYIAANYNTWSSAETLRVAEHRKNTLPLQACHAPKPMWRAPPPKKHKQAEQYERQVLAGRQMRFILLEHTVASPRTLCNIDRDPAILRINRQDAAAREREREAATAAVAAASQLTSTQVNAAGDAVSKESMVPKPPSSESNRGRPVSARNPAVPGLDIQKMISSRPSSASRTPRDIRDAAYDKLQIVPGFAGKESQRPHTARQCHMFITSDYKANYKHEELNVDSEVAGKIKAKKRFMELDFDDLPYRKWKEYPKRPDAVRNVQVYDTNPKDEPATNGAWRALFPQSSFLSVSSQDRRLNYPNPVENRNAAYLNNAKTAPAGLTTAALDHHNAVESKQPV